RLLGVESLEDRNAPGGLLLPGGALPVPAFAPPDPLIDGLVPADTPVVPAGPGDLTPRQGPELLSPSTAGQPLAILPETTQGGSPWEAATQDRSGLLTTGLGRPNAGGPAIPNLVAGTTVPLIGGDVVHKGSAATRLARGGPSVVGGTAPPRVAIGRSAGLAPHVLSRPRSNTIAFPRGTAGAIEPRSPPALGFHGTPPLPLSTPPHAAVRRLT